jgi:hypothetical protein
MLSDFIVMFLYQESHFYFSRKIWREKPGFHFLSFPHLTMRYKKRASLLSVKMALVPVKPGV